MRQVLIKTKLLGTSSLCCAGYWKKTSKTNLNLPIFEFLRVEIYFRSKWEHDSKHVLTGAIWQIFHKNWSNYLLSLIAWMEKQSQIAQKSACRLGQYTLHPSCWKQGQGEWDTMLCTMVVYTYPHSGIISLAHHETCFHSDTQKPERNQASVRLTTIWLLSTLYQCSAKTRSNMLQTTTFRRSTG